MRQRISIRRSLLLLLGALALLVVVLNWTYGRLPAEPRPTGSFAQIGNLRIHYIEHRGAGVPVVLIHGLPGTAEDWEDVTPLLAGHRTIAIDRPGFGFSSGGYVPFERQLELLHQLLARLHVTRPILVGHSYGGTISLGFAERYRGQVRGLVLVDAGAAGQRIEDFTEVQAHAVQFLQLPIIRQAANATFGQLLATLSVNSAESEAFHPEPVVEAHHHRVLAINMTQGNLEAWAGEILAANGVIAQIDKHLRTIRAPAIVIQGEDDELINPTYGRRLAADLPNSHLVMVYGGHMQPYDHPAAIARAVHSVSSMAPKTKSVSSITLSSRRRTLSGAVGASRAADPARDQRRQRSR
jgi:pimeloyl-ACP methyl ester carboxylesterase